MCVFICVYIYIYTYAYTYKYTHTHTHKHTYIHTNKTKINKHINTHTHTHTHEHAHTHIIYELDISHCDHLLFCIICRALLQSIRLFSVIYQALFLIYRVLLRIAQDNNIQPSTIRYPT